MATTPKGWSWFEYVDAMGGTASIGIKPDQPPFSLVSSASEVHIQTHSVAASGIIKLFDIADDLGDFEFAVAAAQQTGQIQFVNNTAANFFTLDTIAKLPFVVPGSGSLDSSGSVGAFDGNSDPIERIYWKNTSSVTSLVTIWIVT